jgi:hypothetical protein
MNKLMNTLAVVALVAFLGACGGGGNGGNGGNGGGAKKENGDGTHTHADGTTHSDADHEGEGDGDDHAHDEEADLGTVSIDGLGEVSGAQGHGMVKAGVESHLVIKLPFNDKGATVVRAWIGTEDPTASHVGMGDYAASHDDYDIHADAPDPLPDDAAWWFEIEKPDGTMFIGTLPILK